MKIKNFNEKIEIPSDIQVSLENMKLTMKGKSGEVTKNFCMPRFKFSLQGNNLIIECSNYNFYDKNNFFTLKAHVKNMITGVNEGYKYILKICSSHFPINVSVSGNKIIVKNLLGEKVPRELVIKSGAKVEVKGTEIEVSGSNIEIVSQVAADIEKMTKLTDRDRRIFQDGIYITHKAGKPVKSR
ncbi:MAG: 50S ribosomal protein L6 [Candidatus Woesearchaeota archaeon]